MKCYIGLGSNLGDRLANLELAAQLLHKNSVRILKTAPVYSSPALVPPHAPDSWRNSFLNSVIEIEWTQSPRELLSLLKKIEKELGRTPSERWAPRIIDLDILFFGNEKITGPDLQIPHAEVWRRAFVLDPLKDLDPDLALLAARKLRSHSPLWMGILNLTPDSFSDGGRMQDLESFATQVKLFEDAGVGILDLGAESTRPGATALNSEQEWSRLKPALDFLKNRYQNLFFKPKLSLDTRHARTAAQALSYPIDVINDVSGQLNAEMLQLLKQTSCDYVLMHSLSIPADPKLVLPTGVDPIVELKTWLTEKLKVLTAAGISLERVIFDPGLGFGKNAEQSLAILRRIEEFSELPIRILIGHSRKSFISKFSKQDPALRDWESIGVSMSLAGRGVDILRVHQAHLHARSYTAYQEVAPWNH